MQEYDFKTIEAKWQKYWADTNYGTAEDSSDKPKHYNLVEFPYPSGAGLHIGHCMGYGASDAYCRMKRMQGANVMYPIGWDAFGLPTENYAIKNKIKPQKATEDNVTTFKKQMKNLGYSFDWSREVNTTDPNYYKWTQWIFLQFYKHSYQNGKLVPVADNDKTTPRMAFMQQMPVNWCPSCKIVLANEEVIAGSCERCSAETAKRNQKQWMLRITSYADRLIEDLDTVDYLEKIKTQQINWIGRSEGTTIKFKLKTQNEKSDRFIEVFTTRADTLFGCTYVVLAPESALVNDLQSEINNWDEVHEYIHSANSKTDMERTELAKDKTGVELKGIKAINPINNEEVSVWVADYVLASYGTGAVMAVPAHDERDFEFAKKYKIDIKEVIIPKVIDKTNPPQADKETVERKMIQGILIDPKTKQILTLKWKKFPWTTFVTGGVEENEDIIEAAKREITEETGYKNFKYIKTLGGPVEAHYYAAHKNVNRKALVSALVFELTSNEHAEISDEEKAIHDLVWASWDEVTRDHNLTCVEYPIWLDRFHQSEHAFTDYGVLINSNEFNDIVSTDAKKKITEKLKLIEAGDYSINYKLRDWIFSRQHYWGEPIPIIHCDKCGMMPVPEDQLPVTLPEVENYEPTSTGESPLAKIDSWINTECPNCHGKAKRETDTMPNWAGSSWYYLRYMDPKSDHFFSKPTFFRPEIELTEKDKNYIKEFKTIYSDLDQKGIKTWAANRFMLNGINRKIWLPFRTISVMGSLNDLPAVEKYVTENGYKLEKVYPFGKLFTRDDIRFEFVTFEEKDGKLISFSEKGAVQEMSKNDLPDFSLGVIDNLFFRTCSPEYNLTHYKFISKNEAETRKGLGDEEKIEFLEEWLKDNSSKRLYWSPVDLYNGGAEHITLHLLYSRFWHKFLYDLGVVPSIEPYKKRIMHGIILGPDGQKMSKSKGNVINPDETVTKLGADTLRAYMMFIGPYDQESAWNNAGVMGVHRFLKRVWLSFDKVKDTKDTNEILVKLNQSIESVTQDIENFHSNTIVSQLMEFNNLIEKAGSISRESFKTYLQLIYPACPHLASELWEKLDQKLSIENSTWPKPDKNYLVADEIEIAIQINGKTKSVIKIQTNASQDEVEKEAKADSRISEQIKGKNIRKIVYVAGRIVNFVVE